MAQVARVGAGAGLGEAEAAERLAGGQPRQPAALLLLAAPARRCVLATSPSETDTMPRTEESPRPSSSVTRQYARWSPPEPPYSSGIGQPEEAEVAELLDDRPVDLLGAVPGGGVRGDLAVDEVARPAARTARCSSLSVKSMGSPSSVELTGTLTSTVSFCRSPTL